VPFPDLGATLVITNAAGLVLKQMKIVDLVTQLDVSILPKGMYFFQLFAEGKHCTAKFIKQ
jgi:hypothetical protein